MPKQTKTNAETQTESLNATDDVPAYEPQSERRRMHPAKATETQSTAGISSPRKSRMRDRRIQH